MDHLTLIVPYYENPCQLRRQIEVWNTYSSKVDIIVIDDGSPRNPALTVLRDKPCQTPLRLWRILQNIPWNQHGARNLGAHVASEGWLALIDMDQILLGEDVARLLQKSLNPKCFYAFEGVRYPDLSPGKWPPNQHILTRQLYWRAGGYDEDYCGTYGGDSILVNNLKAIAPRIKLKDVRLAEVSPEIELDACTQDWDRVYYKDLYRAKPKKGLRRATNPMRFKWEQQL